MATKTAHYGFTKPSEADFYDIQVFNRNLDGIDEQLQKVHERASALAAELSDKSGGAKIGVAEELADLEAGGVLFLTDDDGAEGYAVTLAELLAEGASAARGEASGLAALATVSAANALKLRADSAGTRFASDEAFQAKITALCALALADGDYIADGVLTLSWAQVQGFFAYGTLLTATEAAALCFDWRGGYSNRLTALEGQVEALRALIGDLNRVLDRVNDEEVD